MFVDAKGRYIKISDCYSGIEAYHNEVRIGYLDFEEIEESDYHFNTRLSAMDVLPDYQKAGIGTEMMRLAAEIYGKNFSKPSFSAVGGSGAESHTYYTQDGTALIRKCIRLGILSDTDTQAIHDDD